jgi:membrane associated rhomboid family serine protease
MSDTHYRYTNAVVLVPMLLVLGIWSVFLLELRLQANFNSWGIFPRTFQGLRGILASPWIHGSLEHLYNNTLPLAVLSAALFYFYRNIAWRTLFLGVLISGFITWTIGRSSYHIGASGLIYVLASFIFFKGIITRYYRLVALSLGVVFVYGGLLWYIFPVLDEISWEGHLGGFLTGLLLAIFLKSPVPKEPKYAWESEDYREEADPFMRHFDDEGNFIDEPEGPEAGSGDGIEVRYHYRKEDKSRETD